MYTHYRQQFELPISLNLWVQQWVPPFDTNGYRGVPIVLIDWAPQWVRRVDTNVLKVPIHVNILTLMGTFDRCQWVTPTLVDANG